MGGHALFGLRTTHGEGTFTTVSPNRRHSSLLLHLQRARLNDTSLEARSETTEWRRRLAGADLPRLPVPRGVVSESVEKELGLPPLAIRQKLNAQDPLSSTLRYDVSTRLLLGCIAGTRMCRCCPCCNVFEEDAG